MWSLKQKTVCFLLSLIITIKVISFRTHQGREGNIWAKIWNSNISVSTFEIFCKSSLSFNSVQDVQDFHPQVKAPLNLPAHSECKLRVSQYSTHVTLLCLRWALWVSHCAVRWRETWGSWWGRRRGRYCWSPSPGRRTSSCWWPSSLLRATVWPGRPYGGRGEASWGHGQGSDWSLSSGQLQSEKSK